MQQVFTGTKLTIGYQIGYPIALTGATVVPQQSWSRLGSRERNEPRDRSGSGFRTGPGYFQWVRHRRRHHSVAGTGRRPGAGRYHRRRAARRSGVRRSRSRCPSVRSSRLRTGSNRSGDHQAVREGCHVEWRYRRHLRCTAEALAKADAPAVTLQQRDGGSFPRSVWSNRRESAKRPPSGHYGKH